jgi:hypothetical protein
MHRQREKLVVTGVDPWHGLACGRPDHGNQPRGAAAGVARVLIEGPLSGVFARMFHKELEYGMIQSFTENLESLHREGLFGCDLRAPETADHTFGGTLPVMRLTFGRHMEQHPAKKELLDGHNCRCAQQV